MQSSLKRTVTTPSALFFGFGSILGTGVFVSIGIAVGYTGPSVLWAIALASIVAMLSGLSSAQLATNHPVSGGTYEYANRYLNQHLGFLAGWIFLCAKSASAATAALGCAGYLLSAISITNEYAQIGFALAIVVSVVLVVYLGMRISSQINTLLVSITLGTLVTFIVLGFNSEPLPVKITFENGALGFLEATALMFVAYTGYGRIATLGEEVQNPRKTIPRAIVITLCVAAGLYMLVAYVGLSILGWRNYAEITAESSAPLKVAAQRFNIGWVISIGAWTAMFSVLLNLTLGLSRVVLAMARRNDLPKTLAHIDQNDSPGRAVIAAGVIIMILVLVGNVKTTWSFSAFTVLIYYALTNLSALKLKTHERLYSPIISLLGLGSCLGLAFCISFNTWILGLILIIVGFVFRGLKSK